MNFKKRPGVSRSLLCLLLCVTIGAGHAGDRPNIVLVMTDDQGYGDLGVTGNPVIRTPHIDHLASEAASLSQFYVSPVCSPTRACLMTGRYNFRTKVIDTFKGRSMMDPSEITVAEILRANGYATGIFGKWHLGDNFPMRPMDQGFDESLIHRGGGLAQPSEPLENNRRYTDPILFRNGERVETEGYCTDVYFDGALQFIERNVHDDKPFFVYLPTNAPHGPYHDVPEELYNYYKSIDLSAAFVDDQGNADRLARIFAMIENVDENVGRLDETLKELDAYENTIVIFMVDNGPNSRRYVGPFRGMKSEVHEGGIRSPFFIRWPSELEAGVSSDRIAAHIDLAPTLCAAAGVGSPEYVAFDGRNLLPLLRGEPSVVWPDRALFIQAHRGDHPVAFHHFALRTQDWKLLRASGFQREEPRGEVPFELYDMRVDPGETRNLAAVMPDRVDTLKKLYSDWLEDVSSTRPNNYEPPRIVIGSEAEPVTVLSRQDWRVSIPDGWGVGGAWLVEMERDARVDVKILFSEAPGRGVVGARIGERIYSGRLPEGVKEALLPGIEIEKGETSIQAWGEVGEEKRDPYHVVVEVRD